MNLRGRLAFAFLAVAAAALGVLAGRSFAPARTTQTLDPAAYHSGVATLFATTLEDTAGKTQSIAQWRGKTLVVNFWATWCPPCRNEMPAFSRQQNAFWRHDVRFIAIALDDAAAVRAFQHDIPVSFPLLLGNTETGALARALGNTHGAIPYTVLIDAEGTLRHAQAGELDEPTLISWLRQSTGQQPRE